MNGSGLLPIGGALRIEKKRNSDDLNQSFAALTLMPGPMVEATVQLLIY